MSQEPVTTARVKDTTDNTGDQRLAYTHSMPLIPRLDTAGLTLSKYPQAQSLTTSVLRMQTPRSLGTQERATFQADKARRLYQANNAVDVNIDKLIDSAHMRYHKAYISHYFTESHSRQAILERGYLSQERLNQVSKAIIDLEMHFFRDPKALEAIARHLLPECRTCHHRGDICDRYLNVLSADQDVFAVDDGTVWGVMIAMSCQCCLSNGYDFVPRIEYDVEGRPRYALAQLTPMRATMIANAFSN